MSNAGKAPASVAERVLEGNVRAGARLMRQLDDRQVDATDIMKALYPHTGNARIVGVTGNPGSGKSTLVDRLIAQYRKQDLRVGVVCVDPSSPFSGGAILGDRIRMMDHANDPDVFIRSMATRGAMGGLSRSTYDVVHVLDAMGYDIVLVETVGVGQDEIDVVKLAQTSVVVLVPGLGDDIQAIKAGILEIADIYVINKADHPGVDRTARDLRHLQGLLPTQPAWIAPIVQTVAPRDEGIAELIETVDAHHAFLKSEGGLTQRARERESHILQALVRDRIERLSIEHLADQLDGYVDQIIARKADPYSIAEQVVADLVNGNPVDSSTPIQ